MSALRALLCFCLLAAAAHVCLAQDKKASVDPSGTWRWDFDTNNGEVIKNVLKLVANADGKVTGSLSARDMKMEVIDGKIKDGKLSFQINVEMPNKFKLLFEGKLDGDKVEGKVDASSDQGQVELPWAAKRSVEPSDVIGVWKLNITVPDGQVLQPLLTVSLKDGKLEATMKSEDGKTEQVKKLELKDNLLRFEVDSQYQGNDLHVAYKTRAHGSKLKGMLEYTVDNNSGEIEFTGVLQPEKK